MKIPVDPEMTLSFHQTLLAWFETHRREMPWRQTTDPYRVWISEMMLQQTQVKTVIDYYHRFIERFPDVRSLAAAQPGDVMKAWEGLGYYSRARNLHRAAVEIMERFDGRIPDTVTDLISLPGIGRYTAGAVLSIAFGKNVPVLDGNVMRFLSRLFHITENIGKSAAIRLLWQLSESIMPDDDPASFNQALMEMGALVCRKNPLCEQCPVSAYCTAYRLGIQKDLPVRSTRRPIPHYQVTGGVIEKDGLLLITLRPPRGLLGGLWEFPGGKQKPGETLEECLKREIREELDIEIVVGPLLLSVNHAYTHFRITLHVFRCRYVSGSIKTLGIDDYRWIKIPELEHYAFPAADRKVIEKLKMEEEKIQ